MHDQGLWLPIGVELVIVGVIAAKSRIPTFGLALLVAFAALTWFNMTSPIQASYISQFALIVFLSWLVYIWLVRAIFRRRPKAKS